MTDASEEAASRCFQGLYCEDRKNWLCAFGVLWIFLGAYNMCTILLKGFPANPAWLLWETLLVAWCIGMGIGAIMARRWARTLILASSWFWLIWGMRYIAAFLIWEPDVYGHWAEEGWIPTSYATTMRIGLLADMFIGRILVPYVSIRFFGNKHVKATCERRDRQTRWTDRCPVPVLVASLAFTVWAYLGLLARFHKGWNTVFLGKILTGPDAAVEILAVTTLCIYVAWGVYRLKSRAWWVGLLIVTYWIVGFFVPIPLAAYPASLVERLTLHTWSQGLFYAIWEMAFIVYLLYVRRFFVPPAAAPVEAETVGAEGSDAAKPLSL